MLLFWHIESEISMQISVRFHLNCATVAALLLMLCHFVILECLVQILFLPDLTSAGDYAYNSLNLL